VRPIIPRFPSPFQDGGEVPSDLVGSTILSFGTTDLKSESGEFVIEYRPKDQLIARRLTLLFNERGIWVDQIVDLRPSQGGTPKFDRGQSS
jgi:hypothetical protein